MAFVIISRTICKGDFPDYVEVHSKEVLNFHMVVLPIGPFGGDRTAN